MLQKTADWRSFRTSASNCCEYGELGPSMVARMLPGSIMRYNNTKENDEHQCRRNCFDTTATTKSFIAAYAGGLCREGSKVLQASIAESHSVHLNDDVDLVSTTMFSQRRRHSIDKNPKIQRCTGKARKHRLRTGQRETAWSKHLRSGQGLRLLASPGHRFGQCDRSPPKHLQERMEP